MDVIFSSWTNITHVRHIPCISFEGQPDGHNFLTCLLHQKHTIFPSSFYFSREKKTIFSYTLLPFRRREWKKFVSNFSLYLDTSLRDHTQHLHRSNLLLLDKMFKKITGQVVVWIFFHSFLSSGYIRVVQTEVNALKLSFSII